jgi:hypothetical protein
MRKQAGSVTSNATKPPYIQCRVEGLLGAMEANQCPGGLSPNEIVQLEEETVLKLHTCGTCGRRNLYAIKNGAGHWALEPHNKPQPRPRKDAARKVRG